MRPTRLAHARVAREGRAPAAVGDGARERERTCGGWAVVERRAREVRAGGGAERDRVRRRRQVRVGDLSGERGVGRGVRVARLRRRLAHLQLLADVSRDEDVRRAGRAGEIGAARPVGVASHPLERGARPGGRPTPARSGQGERHRGRAGDGRDAGVRDRTWGDDRGLDRGGGGVVVRGLRGGLDDADRLAEVRADEHVRGTGRTCDVRTVAAGRVAAAPLVGARVGAGAPARGRPGQRAADGRRAGDRDRARVGEVAGSDDDGLGGGGGGVVVGGLAGGLDDADRLAEVGRDERVARAGLAGDVGAVRAGVVAAAPLVGARVGPGRPARGRAGERLADLDGAGDRGGARVGEVAEGDDCGLGGRRGGVVVGGLGGGLDDADGLSEVRRDEHVRVARLAADVGAVRACVVAAAPLVGARVGPGRPARCRPRQELADLCRTGDRDRSGVGEVAEGDDGGLGGSGGGVVVGGLRRGLDDADRLPEIGGHEGVVGARRSGDVGAVRAGVVAASPLVGPRVGTGVPARRGAAQRFADLRRARDRDRGRVRQVAEGDDGGLGRGGGGVVVGGLGGGLDDADGLAEVGGTSV